MGEMGVEAKNSKGIERRQKRNFRIDEGKRQLQKEKKKGEVKGRDKTQIGEQNEIWKDNVRNPETMEDTSDKEKRM